VIKLCTKYLNILHPTMVLNCQVQCLARAQNEWRHAGRLLDSDLYRLQVLNTLMEKSPEMGVRGMPHILPAIIAKLSTAKSSVLIVNLVAVCARLININANQFIDYLASAPSPSAPPALPYRP
jgi:hypothetical protein